MHAERLYSYAYILYDDSKILFNNAKNEKCVQHRMMAQKFVDLQVHDETLSDVSVNLRTRLATKTESNQVVH